MITQIQRKFQVKRILDDIGTIFDVLDCEFTFAKNDPAVVKMTLTIPDDGESATWELSREVLIECLFKKADWEGVDLVVQYMNDPRHGRGLFLCMRGVNADGVDDGEHQHILLSRMPLWLFLSNTLALVPLEEEDYAPAVDEAISRILAG